MHRFRSSKGPASVEATSNAKVRQSFKMRTTIILAVLSALVGAQSPADFPPCSAECLDYAMLDVGCASDAIECGCECYQDINGYITACLEHQCTPAEDEQFRNLAVAICAHAGIPIERPESHELYTIELHNVSDDGDNIITAYTLVTEVASPIEEPTETPYIDMMLVPQSGVTGVPNGVPDYSLPSASYSTIVFSGSSTELSWGTSTGTLERSIEVTSEVVPYPTPIPVYATTSGSTTTIGNSSILSSSHRQFFPPSLVLQPWE
ncbi:hypothetical protein HBI04_020010 [Parastagonospora nodorum]|nr:hypothetical protein HBH42_004930 [Parastagonospora nodorum]KAH4265260.1 hypothetical protein HBI03_081590 [Parastagonospora nodorum]KAH4283198.1 hypothetical protein HBI04_020010 [Parastagonospora nodorum]KAH4973672.1 hypothetical protein HBI78_004880 [Parastagonospora nodorum]KAH5222975.1 hypothetical protein HBH77_029950 [Parastagonospora nodorum]